MTFHLFILFLQKIGFDILCELFPEVRVDIFCELSLPEDRFDISSKLSHLTFHVHCLQNIGFDISCHLSAFA